MNVAIELAGKSAAYQVSDEQSREWEIHFPNINVPQCLCAMRMWLEANQAKRPKNVKRFAVNWLIRETAKFERSWQATHRDALVGRNTFVEKRYGF
jgi:hypothetical protein